MVILLQTFAWILCLESKIKIDKIFVWKKKKKFLWKILEEKRYILMCFYKLMRLLVFIFLTCILYKKLIQVNEINDVYFSNL